MDPHRTNGTDQSWFNDFYDAQTSYPNARHTVQSSSTATHPSPLIVPEMGSTSLGILKTSDGDISNNVDYELALQQSPSSPHFEESQTTLLNIGGQFWFCTQCGKIIERRDRALGHRARHAGINAFECNGACGTLDCDSRFVSKELLRSHYTRPKETCQLCGISLLKRNMARHLREIHQTPVKAKKLSNKDI